MVGREDRRRFLRAAGDAILILLRQKSPLLRRRTVDELLLAMLQVLEHGFSSRLSIPLGERIEDSFVLGNARDEQRPIVQEDVRDHP